MPPRDLTRRSVIALAALALAKPAWAQTVPVRVPFQIIKGKLFIDVVLAGAPVQAMVDTGAVASGVDTAFAQDAGIVADGRSVRLRNIQGASTGRWSGPLSVSVGGHTSARPMLVTDFGLLTSTVLHPIRVLLGADFWSQFVVEFNFDAQAMTLHAPPQFVAPAAALVALSPLRGAANVLRTAPMTVEGRAVQALIDTGSQSPLIVSPAPARRLRLAADRTVSTSPIGSFGGPTTARIVSAKAIDLGGASFADVPVQIAARDLGVEGNVGLDFLSRFHLWLDLAGGRMWLAPRASQPPFERNLLGLFGLPDGDEALRITFVARESPADRAGLKAGDVITRINGEPAQRAHLALVGAAEGARLTLALEGGAERELVLARYY